MLYLEASAERYVQFCRSAKRAAAQLPAMTVLAVAIGDDSDAEPCDLDRSRPNSLGTAGLALAWTWRKQTSEIRGRFCQWDVFGCPPSAHTFLE